MIKTRLYRFTLPGIIRIALLSLMLSAIINLFGDEWSMLKECPMEYDYEITYPNGTKTFGSEVLFTYTFSINPDLATEFDKQRTYSFSSDFFSTEKGHSMYIPVKSDVQNGETFTYSQFPLTKHLTVKLVAGVVELISIKVVGYRVDGCPDYYFTEGDKFIQQESDLILIDRN